LGWDEIRMFLHGLHKIGGLNRHRLDAIREPRSEVPASRYQSVNKPFNAATTSHWPLGSCARHSNPNYFPITQSTSLYNVHSFESTRTLPHRNAFAIYPISTKRGGLSAVKMDQRLQEACPRLRTTLPAYTRRRHCLLMNIWV
jgi:hypothetical protein